MRLPKMFKKGVAGLDFMKQFAIMLFVVCIIFFVLALAGAQLAASTTDTNALLVINNFTKALTGLGSSVSTWIVLAGLVVLISIIVIVVMVVNRMSGGNQGGL